MFGDGSAATISLKISSLNLTDCFPLELLKPCTFNFKNSMETKLGFIAHELQEVIPYAVKGEKDGNIQSWNGDILQNIVNRLNKFLPELDRELWPTTSESWKKVSYKESVRTIETIKLGKKLFKINRD